MEEPGRDGPPPVTGRDRRSVEGALGTPLAQVADGTPGREGIGDEDGQVGGDEHAGDDRLCHRRSGGHHLLAGALGALGAVEAHRGLVHARRADGTVAPLADHAGAPVGMPVTGLHVGGGHG